ncbi:unnamed protein product [Gadus morhua 'NCC']
MGPSHRPTGGPRALFYCGLTRLRAESSAPRRTQDPALFYCGQSHRPTGGPRALFYCGLTRLRAESSAHWRTQSPVLLRFDTSQGRVIGPLEDPEPCSTVVRHVSGPSHRPPGGPRALFYCGSTRLRAESSAHWRTHSPVLLRFDTPRPTGGPRALFYRGQCPPPSGTKPVHTSTHSGGRWRRGLAGGRRLPQMVPWFFFHLVGLWRNVPAPHGRRVWGGHPADPSVWGGHPADPSV